LDKGSRLPMRVAERLPLEAASTRRARALLEPFRRTVAAEAFDALRLVVSELVANCVQHGLGDGIIMLEAVRRDRHVHVAVKCPKGASVPHITTPGHRDGGGGLGLRIVDAVAARWGIGDDGADSLVWAEVVVDQPPRHAGT
jgi:anti-sigma regulatory factor (Ser/Thr protein kinase)